MSKEYRTFEEYRIAELDGHTPDEVDCASCGWYARDAELSAILGEFEALAGKWKEAPDEETYYQYKEIYEVISGCADELSALIQSVKERT